MAFTQWDIVTVPSFVLGLGENPDQFGVIISSEVLRTEAERYWIIQIPNPGPRNLIYGDIEVPQLAGLLPSRPVVVRTSTIFAAHYLDLEDQNQVITELPKKYRKDVMSFVQKFIPRPKLIPGT